MNIKSELNSIFFNVLKVSKTKNRNEVTSKKIKKWDSINHVRLILVIESKFGLKIDPDESIELMSYNEIYKFIKNKD